MTDVTDEDLKALKEEQEIFSEDDEQQAERLFAANLTPAVLAITNLVRTAQSETIQLKAATYVVERNLGRLQDMNPNVAGDLIADIIAGITVEHEADQEPNPEDTIAPTIPSTSEGG